MPKMIQIRDVPDDVHQTLKARAAREGMSLSDFIKREFARSVQRLTVKDWLERVEKGKPIRTKLSSAAMIRKLRDAG